MIASRSLVPLHTILTAANVVAVGLAFALVPGVRSELYREGHIVETLSALLFLGAFCVGLVALRTRRQGYWNRQLVIPALGLLCFLEEMSWGAWELGLTPPRLLGVGLDGIHDLPLLVLAAAVGASTTSSRILILLLVATISALVIYPRRAWLVATIRAVTTSTPWRFVGAAVGFVAVGQILDFVAIDSDVRRVAEEVLEMNGGLALLFAALALYARRLPATASRARGGR